MLAFPMRYELSLKDNIHFGSPVVMHSTQSVIIYYWSRSVVYTWDSSRADGCRCLLLHMFIDGFCSPYVCVLFTDNGIAHSKSVKE